MGIYKKKNRWYIDYYTPDGKRKREVVTIEGVPPERITRQDAVKAHDIRRAEIATGKFNIVETKTKNFLFDKLVGAYIEGYARPRKKSWGIDVSRCKALSGYFGGMRLSKITPWLANKYKLERLKNAPVTLPTVNRELACLKKMLYYAVGEGWLSSNPLAGYKLEKEKPNTFRVLSQSEFKLVYQASISEELRSLLLVGYNTGMRKSEITNLKWEHVDLAERIITVTESKNGESRVITVNEELLMRLLWLRERAIGEYVVHRSGRRIIEFKLALDKAIKRAKVERFTFHALRHTYATNLVMEGVDIVTVQELLGHKSILMTKRYSHPTLEHKKRAAERIKSGVLDTSLDTSVIELVKKSEITN